MTAASSPQGLLPEAERKSLSDKAVVRPEQISL